MPIEPHEPTPQQIQARCAAIRREWSATTYRLRMRPDWRARQWTPPGARAAGVQEPDEPDDS